jgi:ABC-type Na+ efflux pump permease subunit
LFCKQLFLSFQKSYLEYMQTLRYITLLRKPPLPKSISKLRDDPERPLSLYAIITWLLYSIYVFTFAAWASGIAIVHEKNSKQCLGGTLRRLCITNAIFDTIAFLISMIGTIVVCFRECVFNGTDTEANRILGYCLVLFNIVLTVIMTLMFFLIITLGIVTGECQGESPIADAIVPYVVLYIVSLVSVVVLRVSTIAYWKTRTYIAEQNDDYIWYVPKD